MKNQHILKTKYKIGEISALYGISTDTLRYYERLGLLTPERQENGYRLYSLKDLNTLSLIRDLRTLEVPMKQIAERLQDQSIGTTRALLEQTTAYLDEEAKQLARHRRVLRRHLKRLRTATGIEDRTFRIQRFPTRPCLRLSEYITTDEELDYLLRQLQNKGENILTLSSQMIGASLSVEDLLRGTPNVYTSAFFVLESDTERSYDFLLPAGDYLSFFYRGDYQQNPERLRDLLRYGEENHLSLDENVFEIYWTDNRDSLRPEEFVTEIQVQILR